MVENIIKYVNNSRLAMECICDAALEIVENLRDKREHEFETVKENDGFDYIKTFHQRKYDMYDNLIDCVEAKCQEMIRREITDLHDNVAYNNNIDPDDNKSNEEEAF